MRFKAFAEFDGYDTFQNFLSSVKKEIEDSEDDYILNVDEKEWEEYFIDKYEIPQLEVYTDKLEIKLDRKEKRFVEQYGRTGQIEYYIFNVLIPYTGHSLMFKVRPSTYVLRTYEIQVTGTIQGNIVCEIVLGSQDKNQFEQNKREIIAFIEANVKTLNKDIAGFNSKISSYFQSILSIERKRIVQERSFFESLNISIDQSTEDIFVAPKITKKRIPQPRVDEKSKKKYTTVPIFENELYEDILKVIYQLYKNVEKKPSIYGDKNEEELRDYLLPVIETRYEGSTATGETFNKGGKTDILLKYKDGTNLFVAECKFWKGKKSLHDTIDQLFDNYLTWRDSKVAIIFFVENKDFSHVLDEIKDNVVNHPYYFRENGSIGESSFSYIFHFPNDSQKKVYTEIMAFSFK